MESKLVVGLIRSISNEPKYVNAILKKSHLGQRFALMEEKTILAWIFRHFTVTSITRRDQVRPKAELILRPTDPIKLELKLRRKLNF